MTDKIRTGVDWEDVRVFVALARHGSMSATARALSVNHATVSRRVAGLEQSLGEKLVARRQDGYVLTAAGTQALVSATEMEIAAAALGRGSGETGPRGLVRVSATPALAQGFLAARLPEITLRHPHLDIELSTNMRAVSLERREADIALRLSRPEDGDMVARHLVSVGYGFYAGVEWRARIEAGETPVFIGFDEANAHIPDALWLTRHFPKARVAFRTDSQFTQAAVARTGAGIALLPHFVGRPDGRLCSCPLAVEPPVRDLWLVKRRHHQEPLALRMVADYLSELFSEQREIFQS